MVKSFPDYSNAVSAIIVNSKKGTKLLDGINKANIVTLIETSYSVIADQNLPLKHPTERPKVRNFAIKWIDKYGFITTCRLLGAKYYLRSFVKTIGGDKLLNFVKRLLGRTIIEH